MKMNELLPGKFLRQQDVPQPANVTISGIDEMIVDAVSNESKPVVFFREYSKGMVANTNCSAPTATRPNGSGAKCGCSTIQQFPIKGSELAGCVLGRFGNLLTAA